MKSGRGGFNDSRLFAIDTVCESKLAIRYTEQIFIVRKCRERGKKEIGTNIGLSTLHQHTGNVQRNIKACLYSRLSHPTRKTHPFGTVLYCHLWSICINHIFLHYLINGTFRGTVTEQKMCVLIFSTTFV